MKNLSKLAASFFLVIAFYACKKETALNHPPVARAGNDQTVLLPNNSLMLDGSTSSDPENNITAFTWTKISGPISLTISNANLAQTVVTDLIAGIYDFELKVSDAGGLSSRDTLRVFVIINNRPPLANAGGDQIIILPTNSTTLDGGASTDPDNNISGYLWRKISGPASLTIANANAIQTMVSNLDTGIYQFELKVTDAGGLYSTDTVRIDVYRAVNHPPIAIAGSDQTLNYPATATTLNGSASWDPDNGQLTYRWTEISGSAPSIIADSNSAITNVSFPQTGAWEFELKVTDNTGLSSTDNIIVYVLPANMLQFNNLTWTYSQTNQVYYMESPVLTAQQLNNVDRVFILLHDFPFFGEYWAEAMRNSAPIGSFYFRLENNRVVVYIDGQSGNWMILMYHPDAMFINLN